jgi:hypothetical protein
MLDAMPKKFEIGKMGRKFAIFSDLQLRLALFVICIQECGLKPGI